LRFYEPQAADVDSAMQPAAAGDEGDPAAS
jgi:hypothetical protein